MKIVELDVQIPTASNDGPAYWVSNFIVPRANELLVRIRTRDGVEGFGLATSYSSAEPMIQAFKSGIADLVLGEDASAPERLYEKLFGLTSQRVAYEKGWGREPIIRILSAIDIACWDAIGKAANMALYRLFGGYRDTVPYYVTCAYYRDGKTIPEIKDELQQLKSKGHRAFKAKVGGLPLKEDIARIEAIREVIGADDDLMIDVNRGWSLQTAIEGARLLEPLDVRWLEEPVRWNDDHRELRLLAQQTKIPLSGGESELTMFRCRDLIEDHAIQILQADSTMSGGYTALKNLLRFVNSIRSTSRRITTASSMHLSSHRRPPDSFWNRSTRIAIPYRQSCSKIRRRLERLRTQLQRLRQIAKRRPPRMAQTVVEHLAICAAIQDGDETAAVQATALHINNSLHNIVAAMTDDVIGHTTFATPTTAD
jgi:L-alanine-DL-glutamate epimerase-like enolase superfamily enzyme